MGSRARAAVPVRPLRPRLQGLAGTRSRRNDHLGDAICAIQRMLATLPREPERACLSGCSCLGLLLRNSRLRPDRRLPRPLGEGRGGRVRRRVARPPRCWRSRRSRAAPPPPPHGASGRLPGLMCPHSPSHRASRVAGVACNHETAAWDANAGHIQCIAFRMNRPHE